VAGLIVINITRMAADGGTVARELCDGPLENNPWSCGDRLLRCQMDHTPRATFQKCVQYFFGKNVAKCREGERGRGRRERSCVELYMHYSFVFRLGFLVVYQKIWEDI
jgi:hypothetical protein